MASALHSLNSLPPMAIKVAVCVIIMVFTTVLWRLMRRTGGHKDQRDADSNNVSSSAARRRHELEVEKVREIVKEHLEKKEKSVELPTQAASSSGTADVSSTSLAGEAKVVKKSHKKAKKATFNPPAPVNADPDSAIIALFEKSGHRNAKVSKKQSKHARKRHPKNTVGASGGYNTDESEEDEDEIVGRGFGPKKSVPAASASPALTDIVTPAMLAKAAETQLFATADATSNASHTEVSASEQIANLKQLELSAELEASLIAGLATESTDNYYVSGTTTDGWAVVEDKRVRNSKREQQRQQQQLQVAAGETTPGSEGVLTAESESCVLSAQPTPSQTPALPTIDIAKAQLNVESSRVGLIVGARGSTLKALQEATGVEIIAPRFREAGGEISTVTIHLVGPSEGVTTVTKAIEELCAKGYTALLEGPDFGETSINVPAGSVADIVGKGGNTRRVLQESLGVRIVVPPASAASSSDNTVKINVAGPRAKVSEAKKLLKELIRYHHTSVTHPDLAHVEYDPSHAFYHYLNTCRGSDIRTLQQTHKVVVHLPTDSSVCKNVLLVGEVSNLNNAQLFVQKQVEQLMLDKSAAQALSESWGAATTAASKSTVAQQPASAATGSAVTIPGLISPSLGTSVAESTPSINGLELGSSISNPWLGSLVAPVGTRSSVVGSSASSPPINASSSSQATSSQAAPAVPAAGWDPSASISSAEGW